jgi:hypothetical protein
MERDPVLVVARVARALEQCGTPYLVGGSLASSRYGLPRTTQDVDLAIDLKAENVRPLIAALQDEFYVDESMIREAISSNSSFNVIHFDLGHKVDLFLLPSTPWSAQQMARRRVETIRIGNESISLAFCSPEDIILHKLDWYRQGGGISDRQWSDVAGVLKVQSADLDLGYLRRWAAELGLSDLLEKAFAEAAGS